jgi:hypothetical protein
MTFPPGPAVPEAAVVDGVNVDAVAAAVLGCAGVAGLDGGRFGEVASYLPGRKVPGVVVWGGGVWVTTRPGWGVPGPHGAPGFPVVRPPHTGSRPVDVVIADIDDPPGTPEHPTAVGGSDLAAGPLI